MKQPGNNTQTLIGTLIGAATAAVGAWQINAGSADALDDAHAGWQSCQETIQEIALNVSKVMEHHQ